MAQAAAPAEGYSYVNFTIDAELLRELGERLVGKPYVALAELVKNAYDADAIRCVIQFGPDSIEIADNGNGMSHSEFVGKWMRIGSTHKREERISPQFERPLTGSKGIGRLSAQFLGSQIEVRSVPRTNPSRSMQANVDWQESYQKGSLVEAGAWVKDRAGTKILPHKFQHGTSIRITGLKDRWTSEMFRELAGELWFLQPPRIVAADIDVASRFNIELKGVSESDLEQYESQTKAALGNWIARIRGTVENGRASREAKIRLEFSDGEKHTATYSLPNGALDQARFDVLIFKLSGRQAGGISVEDARKYFKRFGGVHIYDSGFRLPYYGGGEHDWLSLEVAHSHRLIQSQILPEALRPEGGTLQDLPTLARVFGVVRVSTSHESQTADAKTPPSRLLTVQVTRDKLIDNLAYADLEYFVRWAFDFYSYHSTARRTRAAAETISSFVDAIDTRLETVRLQAMALKSKVPAKLVEPLEQALDRFEEAQEKRRIEADAERVLLGALATAGMGSVALQHELAKELISLTEQIKALDAQLVGEEREETKEAVRSLKKWVKTASQTRLMFAPFFHVEDRDRPKRLRVGRTLKRLASNLAPLLRGTEVEIDDIDDNLQLPKGTFAGWNAVFQNIFVNAVNAMLETPQKRIRCRAQSDSKGRVRLIVEDTGVGLDIDSSEELFRPFARKLELSEERQALGFGGMGIGLTIVRMVCRTYGCEIHFIRPRAPFKTALEITWTEVANG